MLEILSIIAFSAWVASPRVPATLPGERPARSQRSGIHREAVVLLHGLGRTPRSMKRLERVLADEGYHVANVGYPARHQPIEELASSLDRELSARHLDVFTS